MLAAWVLRLRAEQAEPNWPPALGRAVHGAVLRLLDDLDPPFATALHDWPRPGPLTLAPLGRPTDGTLEVRLTVLDPELLDRVSPLLDELSSRNLYLGRAPCRLEQLLANSDDHPLAGGCRLADLLATPAATRWELRFLTPTSFKLNHVYSPLPFPRSLWGSWLRRWNDLTPSDLAFDPAFLDRLDHHLQLTRMEVQAEPTCLAGPEIVGFVGVVALEARRHPPGQLLRTLSVLADYAFWCGTGVQTMAGLGVTETRGSA